MDQDRFTFMPDERIAELFPNPEFAARVRIIRDHVQVKYDAWKLSQSENRDRPSPEDEEASSALHALQMREPEGSRDEPVCHLLHAQKTS